MSNCIILDEGPEGVSLEAAHGDTIAEEPGVRLFAPPAQQGPLMAHDVVGGILDEAVGKVVARGPPGPASQAATARPVSHSVGDPFTRWAPVVQEDLSDGIELCVEAGRVQVIRNHDTEVERRLMEVREREFQPITCDEIKESIQKVMEMIQKPCSQLLGGAAGWMGDLTESPEELSSLQGEAPGWRGVGAPQPDSSKPRSCSFGEDDVTKIIKEMQDMKQNLQECCEDEDWSPLVGQGDSVEAVVEAATMLYENTALGQPSHSQVVVFLDGQSAVKEWTRQPVSPERRPRPVSVPGPVSRDQPRGLPRELPRDLAQPSYSEAHTAGTAGTVDTTDTRLLSSRLLCEVQPETSQASQRPHTALSYDFNLNDGVIGMPQEHTDDAAIETTESLIQVIDGVPDEGCASPRMDKVTFSLLAEQDCQEGAAQPQTYTLRGEDKSGLTTVGPLKPRHDPRDLSTPVDLGRVAHIASSRELTAAALKAMDWSQTSSLSEAIEESGPLSLVSHDIASLSKMQRVRAAVSHLNKSDDDLVDDTAPRRLDLRDLETSVASISREPRDLLMLEVQLDTATFDNGGHEGGLAQGRLPGRLPGSALPLSGAGHSDQDETPSPDDGGQRLAEEALPSSHSSHSSSKCGTLGGVLRRASSRLMKGTKSLPRDPARVACHMGSSESLRTAMEETPLTLIRKSRSVLKNTTHSLLKAVSSTRVGEAGSSQSDLRDSQASAHAFFRSRTKCFKSTDSLVLHESKEGKRAVAADKGFLLDRVETLRRMFKRPGKESGGREGSQGSVSPRDKSNGNPEAAPLDEEPEEPPWGRCYAVAEDDMEPDMPGVSKEGHEANAGEDNLSANVKSKKTLSAKIKKLWIAALNRKRSDT